MTSLLTVGAILLVLAVIWVIAANWHFIEAVGFYVLQCGAAVVGLVLVVGGIEMNSIFGGVLVLVGLLIGGAGVFNLIHGG